VESEAWSVISLRGFTGHYSLVRAGSADLAVRRSSFGEGLQTPPFGVLRSARVSRPRRSADGRSPGDPPTVGDRETGCRSGRRVERAWANQPGQDRLFTCTERASGSEKLRFWEFRQSSIPESGAADGRAVGHRAVVPVDVISQPEPHPTTLEGHAALRLCGRCQPIFPALSCRHPRGCVKPRTSSNRPL